MVHRQIMRDVGGVLILDARTDPTVPTDVLP